MGVHASNPSTWGGGGVQDFKMILSSIEKIQREESHMTTEAVTRV